MVVGPLLGGVLAWLVYHLWLDLEEWTWIHSAACAGVFMVLHTVSLLRVRAYLRRHPELQRTSTPTPSPEPDPAPSAVGDDGLSRLLTGVASVGVLAMMGLIGAEVVGRYLLGTAIDGKNDILGILMALTVAFALPAATWKSEHIDVDLLEALVPAKAKRWRTLIIDMVVVMSLGIITWYVFLLVHERWDRPFGAKVTPVLEWPMVPVGYAIVTLMLLSTVGLAVRAVWKLTAHRAPDPHNAMASLE